jgi:hypothetical protein
LHNLNYVKINNLMRNYCHYISGPGENWGLEDIWLKVRVLGNGKNVGVKVSWGLATDFADFISPGGGVADGASWVIVRLICASEAIEFFQGFVGFLASLADTIVIGQRPEASPQVP